MKYSFLFFFVVISLNFSFTSLHAQTLVVVSDSTGRFVDVAGGVNGAELQLPSVKNKPDFKGGKIAWMNFIRSQFNPTIPFSNQIAPGIYETRFRIVISDSGKIVQVIAETNKGYGLEAELARCIRLSPDWVPAETANGKKVRFTIRQVIRVKATSNDISIL